MLDGERVLVIDDDASLRRLIEMALSKAGGQVYTAADGVEGLRQLYACQPDLVVLDVTMPGMDGWETLRRIRQLTGVPVIIVSGQSREDDVLRGLENGADDFVTKPFSVKVLAARVQVALRRASVRQKKEKPAMYEDDRLRIDLRERRVVLEGEPVKLTPKEFQLLSHLLQNADQVVTVRQILDNVWGREHQDDPSYVRVYMWHLRQKLEKNPRKPAYLLTKHGVGYRFQRQANGRSNHQ